jgi:hypothetical protein
MTKLTRSQMRLYQRERRARLRSQTPSYPTIGKCLASASPVVDKALPRNATTKASDRDIAAIRAKVAAIGPSAVMTKTPDPVGGKLRLDVIAVDAFKARQNARSVAPAPIHPSAPVPTPYRPSTAPVLHGEPPEPSRTSGTRSPGAEPSRELANCRPPLQGEILSPPRSMIASGGVPPSPYAKGAGIAEATALIRAHAMEQRRVNAELARRLVALEHAKGETDRRISAIEERRAGIVAVVQGIASIFSLV